MNQAEFNQKYMIEQPSKDSYRKEAEESMLESILSCALLFILIYVLWFLASLLS
jgi:hypothetical protein